MVTLMIQRPPVRMAGGLPRPEVEVGVADARAVDAVVVLMSPDPK
jgi:hypothetical protein